jgi:hypothetical protein
MPHSYARRRHPGGATYRRQCPRLSAAPRRPTDGASAAPLEPVDPLAPARGIGLAMLLGVALWALPLAVLAKVLR